tara:strand:- start:1073 stop:1750 length:678 start_codon:yes stop_codon:yes gene_type:complete
MSPRYAKIINDLKLLLLAIEKRGMPTKVTDAYMISLGMPPSSDGTKLNKNSVSSRGVLIGMKLISDDFVPTELWATSRTNFQAGMAEGLKNLYPDPDGVLDADNPSDLELTNLFRSMFSNLAPPTIKMCIRTFRTIEGGAKGDSISPAHTAKDDKKKSTQVKKNATSSDKDNAGTKKASKEEVAVASATTPQLTINIQLHVPSDPTGDVYEKFFTAMKKHLLTNE